MTASLELEAREVHDVTCLGCGCACDDVTVALEGASIVRAEHACSLGEAWFGDGRVPALATVDGVPAALETALARAATMLVGADRVLVELAPQLTCEAQREGVAIADRIGAIVDASATAAERALLLATQRRGNATATLGELRLRADVAVFWGCDPARTHPRFASRFLPPARGSRRVVAVDVGEAQAIEDADERIALAQADEVEALSVLRMLATRPQERVRADAAPTWLDGIAALAERVAGARYVALVCAPGDARTNPRRSEALVAVAQALNDATRAALVVLRAGGNQMGAEAVLTWQIGFPAAVDFARGAPRYTPGRQAATLLRDGSVDVLLLLGDATDPGSERRTLVGAVPTILIGPRASALAREAVVTVDTGVAGIHEAGLAIRMDGVPLPLRAPLPGVRSATAVLRQLAARLGPRGVTA